MKYVPVGGTCYFSFPTQTLAQVKATLSGTPVVKAYKNGSTTESTAGITLTVDFDSITGHNLVTVDTSADGTFYATGAEIRLVITAGTVDSISVVGEVIATFTMGPVRAVDNSGNDIAVASKLVGTIASGTHNAQSGDAYAIVNSGTYGNSALKTLIDAVGTLATAIYGVVSHVSYGNSALNSDLDAILAKLVGTLGAGTHTAQTGDAYAIVNNGTYGNSALKTAINAISGGTGTGPYELTLSFVDELAEPLQNARVSVRLNDDVMASGTTDVDGIVTLDVASLAVYRVVAALSGYLFSGADLTVTGDMSPTAYVMTTAPAPSRPAITPR